MLRMPSTARIAAPDAGDIQRGIGNRLNAVSHACTVRTKNTLAIPQAMPRMAKAGAVAMFNAVAPSAETACALTPKRGSCVPRRVCTVAAANTEEITIGVKVRSEKSRRRTSSTKKIPVIGALNTAASPAAAPQPSMVVAVRGSTRRKREMIEPSVAPMVTIGPSGPAEPPVAMIAVAPNQVRSASVAGSCERRRWIA